jgi:competence/damage-inducible protein CinA-like protein
MYRAEILAIGDELLSGETVDTNSSYLDHLLEGLGWSVARHITVGDDVEAISEAFDLAARRSDLVLSTGGLGPTKDDLTMAGLARALGCDLVRHEPTIEAIKERFRAFGREMTPNNEQQAMVPEIGEVLENKSGTAPSFTTRLHQASVFLMPGVPREVRWLMENQIGPRIPKNESALFRRTIKVIGMGESKVEHTIRDVVKKHREIHWGYRTLGIENHIKMLARGPERARLVAAAETDLRATLGDKIFGADGDLLSVIVGGLLKAAHRTVALAESCTGGLAAKILTDVSGSSAYVLGGAVAYANEAKVELLGVRIEDLERHGAVSEVVARQMAEGIRTRLGASYGLSATGIAGPTGGTPDKPVGTVWIAVASEAGTDARLIRIPGDREFVRIGAASAVIDLLRLTLLGRPGDTA